MRANDLYEVSPSNNDKDVRYKEFINFCFKFLKIKNKPKIVLSGKNDVEALGYFIPDEYKIVVVEKGRHQMDVMRTLAHELVHVKQLESHELDGETGSKDENEANAIAGVLLRYWGKQNPDQFNEDVMNPLSERTLKTMIGSIVFTKQYQLALEALNKLIEEYPNKDVMFLASKIADRYQGIDTKELYAKWELSNIKDSK